MDEDTDPQLIETMETSQERLESQPSLPTTDPQPRNTVTGFFNLPKELRLEIYYYLIPRQCIIDVSHPRLPICNHTLDLDHIDDFRGYFLDSYRNRNKILILSKQISNECLDIIYGENLFKVTLSEENDLKKYFTEENRGRMKYIAAIAQPWAFYYENPFTDSQLWASTLPHLKTIRIIARQPHFLHSPGSTMTKEEHPWIKWIEFYFKEFGRLLVNSLATIQVDCDGKEETNELVDKYLPNTCQKIQCSIFGDYMFRRKLRKSSDVESGYWKYFSDDEDLSF